MLHVEELDARKRLLGPDHKNMLSSMTGNTLYSAILLIAPSTSAQGAIAQSNVDMTENPGEEVQHAAYGDGARTAYFIFSKQKGRAAYPRPSHS